MRDQLIVAHTRCHPRRRHGAVECLGGKITHRQRHPVMVTVWAPNETARAALAKAIDVQIKAKNKVSMPDTSQALVIYNRTSVSDPTPTRYTACGCWYALSESFQ